MVHILNSGVVSQIKSVVTLCVLCFVALASNVQHCYGQVTSGTCVLGTATSTPTGQPTAYYLDASGAITAVPNNVIGIKLDIIYFTKTAAGVRTQVGSGTRSVPVVAGTVDYTYTTALLQVASGNKPTATYYAETTFTLYYLDQNNNRKSFGFVATSTGVTF